MARIPYVWVEAARLLGVCLLAGAGLGLIVSLFRRPT